MERKVFSKSLCLFSFFHVHCLFHIECIIFFFRSIWFGLVVYLEAFVALLLHYQSYFL